MRVIIHMTDCQTTSTHIFHEHFVRDTYFIENALFYLCATGFVQ